MKIGIITWGSDGDILPFIALAGGLKRSGHDISLSVASVDAKIYEAPAKEVGVEIRHVVYDYPWNPNDFMRQCRSTTNPVKQLEVLVNSLYAPATELYLKEAVRLDRENELVIAHQFISPFLYKEDGLSGDHAAVILCHNSIPSRHMSMYGFPNLGGWFNTTIWKLGGWMVNRAFLKSINRARNSIGYAPVNDMFCRGMISSKLNLIAVSGVFAERMDDWDDTFQVCGHLTVPAVEQDWEPPDELVAFFDQGEPPVLFNLGTMVQGDLEGFTSMLVEAALKSGRRALVQSYWDSISSVRKHPDVYRIGRVPHSKIFPKISMMVHHGGAGTTHSTLMAGKPGVIVPCLGDQAFWASEINRIGAGGSCTSISSATPKKLADEVNRTLTSTTIAANVKELSGRMNRENGVERAVQIIEKVYGNA